jgi:sulfite reductase (NADPH) flavoprotein alpha-component
MSVAANPQEIITSTVSATELTALQTTVAHFDREQLIWSSGFLAGLASSAAPQAAVDILQPLVANDSAAATWNIFYATETGNSRKVAEQLASAAAAAAIPVELHDLDVTRPKVLRNIENAVFVLATHGIGEAPEGSETFFEYWLSDKAIRLENLNYSVLALGDSSYADFCEMGRVFDARLSELGAKAVIDRIDCDLDFESPATIWTDAVVAHAIETGDAVELPRPVLLSAVPTTPTYSRTNPYSAEILQRQQITGRGSSKQVQHIELDLEGSKLRYEPGDSLAVMPRNPPQLVDELARITGLDGDIISEKEITALSRPILDAVAELHPQLQSILADRDQFSNYLATRQLIDVAHEFPVAWDEPQFIEKLRNLSPRSYSIASSLDANPDEAHLTVAVVDYEQYGRRHWGAASNFLSGETSHAPIFVEPNEHFRLPVDSETPIIMIGAGTGVAPYRAFIEHRREHGHSGDNWLFFGDRNVASDFLYQLEWLRHRKDGLLTNLDVAFSRDQASKIYVQDRLLKKGPEIYAWLERGAHIYVCGDANRMAGDVHSALESIVKQHGGFSDEQTQGYVKTLKQTQRYQRDVY